MFQHALHKQRRGQQHQQLLRGTDDASFCKQHPNPGRNDAPRQPHRRQKTGDAREHQRLQKGVVHVIILHLDVSVDRRHHFQLVKALEHGERMLRKRGRNGTVHARAPRERSQIRQQGALGDDLLAVAGGGNHLDRRAKPRHGHHGHKGHQAHHFHDPAPFGGNGQALKADGRRNERDQQKGDHARSRIRQRQCHEQARARHGGGNQHPRFPVAHHQIDQHAQAAQAERRRKVGMLAQNIQPSVLHDAKLAAKKRHGDHFAPKRGDHAQPAYRGHHRREHHGDPV